MLYISGLVYEAYINGKRVGDQVLSPTPTDYTKSVKYNTFDVTDHLQSGENAIAVVLGNGRFFNMRTIEDDSYPRFHLPRTTVSQDDPAAGDFLRRRERRAVVSDDSWKVTANA